MNENKDQNQIVPYSKEFVDKAKEFKRLWSAKYKEISEQQTSHKKKKRIIGKKDGRNLYEDYLEAHYMEALLDKNFPGWSLKCAHPPILHSSGKLIIAGVTLEIIDEHKFKFLVGIGVPPEKASYTREYYGLGGGIYYLSKNTGNPLHASNPAKTAVTEAFKYSINRLTHIGDDTYKREEQESLTLQQYSDLLVFILESGMSEEDIEKAKKMLMNINQRQINKFKETIKEKAEKNREKEEETLTS